MEKRKIFLTYQEQEKVLLNIIAQGEYQQLPQMVKNGYPLSMTVLETLRWSRQTSLIIRLLKKEFAYVGDNAALFDFLQTLLGEKQAARLIVEESQKNENCLEEHPLAGLLIYLPPEMLAENGFWDKLKQNHEWQILAKYGHIDYVILMETWTYPAEAAKVLSEYQAEKRIVELKKYLWLVKMPDGPDLLWQEKQFDILFQNRNRLNGWSEEETCKKLCSCPEGCEFLYQAGKSGRDILLSHGCFEPFRKHGEWTFLIRKKRPDAVDWQKWREEALASGSKRTLQLFYQEAARAEKWQILVEDGQHLLLLLHGQFRLFGKSLLHSSPKTEERRQNGGCGSRICDDEA